MKRIISLLCTLLLISLGASTANAVAVQGDDFAEVIRRLQENDVPAAQIVDLVDKLERGEDWDVFTGAEPVSVETRLVGSFEETIERFEDGSYTIHGIEIAKPMDQRGISVFSVSNCRSSASGSGFRTAYDCQAYESTAQFALGFYISYTLGQGGYDYIIEAYAPYGQSYYGTLSPLPPKLVIGKKTESASGPAWAQVSTQFTSANNNVTKPLIMVATVGKDKASTYWGAK